MPDSRPTTTEAAVAELRAEIRGIRDSITDLKGIMAGVAAVAQQVAAMQTDQGHHKEALERLFGRVEGMEKRMDAHETINREAHDEMSDRTAEVSVKMKMYAFGAGAFMSGVVCVWVVFAWVLKNDLVGILQAIAKAGHGSGM